MQNTGSIWKEEVDKGLLEEIKSSVKYKNKSGIEVPIDCVLIRKPEEDFKPEKYPCVSVYNLDDTFSTKRHNPNPVMQDIHGSVGTMKNRPVPFDLSYQLDFWARYQDDMNVMTRSWLEEHFRQFNLPIIDTKGIERTCNCLRKTGKLLVKSDLMSGGERLFHSIISYNIWVEIAKEKGYNVNVVTKIHLGVTPK